MSGHTFNIELNLTLAFNFVTAILSNGNMLLTRPKFMAMHGCSIKIKRSTDESLVSLLVLVLTAC